MGYQRLCSERLKMDLGSRRTCLWLKDRQSFKCFEWMNGVNQHFLQMSELTLLKYHDNWTTENGQTIRLRLLVPAHLRARTHAQTLIHTMAIRSYVRTPTYTQVLSPTPTYLPLHAFPFGDSESVLYLWASPYKVELVQEFNCSPEHAQRSI